MTPDLVTVQEYKAYAGISSTNQDATIGILVQKVSHLVKNICRRTFLDYVDDFKVDTYRSTVNNRILLQETPILQVASVQFSDDYGKNYTDLVEFEDYVVDVERDSIEFIAAQYNAVNKVNAFRITYNAGYETIPEDLKLAVFDLVGYYVRNDSAIHSHKSIGSNTVQIEYITNTSLPAHIRRVLDLHTAYYS